MVVRPSVAIAVVNRNRGVPQSRPFVVAADIRRRSPGAAVADHGRIQAEPLPHGESHGMASQVSSRQRGG